MDAGSIVDAGSSLADAGPAIVQAMEELAVKMAPPSVAQPINEIFNLDKLLTNWNVMLMGAVWIGVQTTKRILPDSWFDEGKLLAELLPSAPVAICMVCAMFIPGPWLDPSTAMSQKAVLGLILGGGSAYAHVWSSKLGLHKLLRIESDTRKLPKKKVKPPA